MLIQKGTVIGAKQFKGNIEGRDYDSCKLRVMMAVPTDSENECGFNVTELNYGKSDKYTALAAQKFPFDAELQFDVEIRSGKPVMNLRGIKVINESK
ncbi:MAG: hypothetical protein Q4D78_07140 [Neisseria zoodegmatis]|uniref:hypothetical protein n=1 Tax=Neisseria zoodegmatis TaxID=326523 RepID=UPI0026E95A5B|nr:hypothetical protein [Neisseria zoodegmatis]MDO5069958.1 hypothetical protein [Neisseria zoodegmatis]